MLIENFSSLFSSCPTLLGEEPMDTAPPPSHVQGQSHVQPTVQHHDKPELKHNIKQKGNEGNHLININGGPGGVMIRVRVGEGGGGRFSFAVQFTVCIDRFMSSLHPALTYFKNSIISFFILPSTIPYYFYKPTSLFVGVISHILLKLTSHFLH